MNLSFLQTFKSIFCKLNFDELEKIIICPICLLPFTEPHILKCSHTFCLECLQNAFYSKRECPICRKSIALLSEAVPNRSLGDLMNYLNTTQIITHGVTFNKNPFQNSSNSFQIGKNNQFPFSRKKKNRKIRENTLQVISQNNIEAEHESYFQPINSIYKEENLELPQNHAEIPLQKLSFPSFIPVNPQREEIKSVVDNIPKRELSFGWDRNPFQTTSNIFPQNCNENFSSNHFTANATTPMNDACKSRTRLKRNRKKIMF